MSSAIAQSHDINSRGRSVVAALAAKQPFQLRKGLTWSSAELRFPDTAAGTERFGRQGSLPFAERIGAIPLPWFCLGAWSGGTN